MSIEIITAGGAFIISIVGVIFNYYKIKKEIDSQQKQQKILLKKEIYFLIIKKRYELYANIFKLLGTIRDVDCPVGHKKNIDNDRESLKKIADKIIEQLYSEAGMFMSYETRTHLLKVCEVTYNFIGKKIKIEELIDSYYHARRTLRKDLEFDDKKESWNIENIYSSTIENRENKKLYKMRYCFDDKIVCSPRPGYPNQNVQNDVIIEFISECENNYDIKSIICLLSKEEINSYYKENIIEIYKKNFDKVCNFDIKDFSRPIIEKSVLEKIYKCYKECEKPILIHCGAGEDRTMEAVNYIIDKEKKSIVGE